MPQTHFQTNFLAHFSKLDKDFLGMLSIFHNLNFGNIQFYIQKFEWLIIQPIGKDSAVTATRANWIFYWDMFSCTLLLIRVSANK